MVLRRSWQYVGRTAQLRSSGDYFTTRILDEPLLFLNDGDVLRGFFNVCSRCAAPLAQGSAKAARLVCRSHHCSYSLQGRRLRAPERDGLAQLDPADGDLQPVQVQALGPMIFAALDPLTPGFDEYHAGLAQQCAPFDLARMQHVLSRDYAVAANWKVYVDNYLEGYHLPWAHPGLSREIDYRSYVTELGAHHVLQHAPVRTDATSIYRHAIAEPNASYCWLFPNIMLNLYERQLQVSIVMPVDVERTVVRMDWFALDVRIREGHDARFSQLLERTETAQAEDAAICQAVQRNLRSSAYHSDLYSPQREAAVHLFYRLMSTTSERS
jgi:choline monooxygenase